MQRIRLVVGEVEIEAELNDSATASKVSAALPIDSAGSYWGGEFYFEVPVKAAAENDASDVVEPGTIAYWPPGHCLCLFWGPTPVSRGGECRAANPVNVVGRVLNPEVLPTLKGRKIRVEAR